MMPHMNSTGGDDLASTDEVKVYKDEGEEEEQRKSSENLTEDKVGLVTEGEELSKPGTSFGLKNGSLELPRIPFSDPRLASYFLPPYPSYVNGASHSGFTTKVPLVPASPSPFSLMSLYVNEALSYPPPAHMDLKTGLHRGASMYAIPTPPPGQFAPHHLYPADFSQWQAASHASYGSPMRSAYSPAGSLMSHPGLAGRFSPSVIGHPGGMVSMGGPGGPHSGHPLMSGLAAAVSCASGVVSNGDMLQHQSGYHQVHHTLHDHHRPDLVGGMKIPVSEPDKPKKPHIKKPLNAFMLFMKEMRSKVVSECTLKESAAINQILGRKWHALSREEQAKYYEMARKEKELHQQLYPGWTARDNYACVAKRKKKRKSPHDTSGGMDGKDCAIPKKCRARYGLEHQNQWCKPCRRKKKCIRFLSDNEEDSEQMPGAELSDLDPDFENFTERARSLSPSSMNSADNNNAIASIKQEPEIERPRSCQSAPPPSFMSCIKQSSPLV